MQQIDIDRFAERLNAGVSVVDVRETSEFVSGHIPGAVNIPMSQLARRLGEIDQSSPVYLVCRSGNRSGAMADFLSAQRYEAINIIGGTDAWIRSGRDIERA